MTFGQPNPDKAELIQAMKDQLAAARVIAETAEKANRGYTPDEHAKVSAHVDAAKRCKQKIDDLDIRGAIDDLFGGTKAAVTGPSKHRSAWVKETVDRIGKVNQASGVKALVTGSIDTPSPVWPGITPMAQAPTRLLDLLVDRIQLSGTNTFSYLRQTARTNLAAPVADGGLKPTSVYTVAEVEDRVRVVAHLSEAVPERYFADHAELERFLATEMEEGLYRAIEEQVLNGDGTGENMTGLTATSGIIAQAWSSDLLTTLRKAVTELAVAGETPNAWAIHPADTEVLDLLADNEARMYYDGPQNQLRTAPLWSLPVVQSTAVTEGTAILGDWSNLALVVREDARLDVDRSGTLFEKNQVKLRLESRVGVAVRRASAFVEVDLTSA